MAGLRIFSVVAFLITTLSAQANDLAAPSGKVVLSITGDIALTNGGDAARFDLDMLRQLPVTSFKTNTIWTQGVQEFTGVSLDTLAQHVGMSGAHLTVSAINDYHVDIPLSDARQGGPIVAYLRNGEEMSVRNRGPLWIVYPYDQSPEFRTEIIYSRSVWQLDRIKVVN